MPGVDRSSVTITIDYPPTPCRRWGLGERRTGDLPGNAPIERLLSANEANIGSFLSLASQTCGRVLGDVGLEAGEHDPAPRWAQTWLPASDAAALVGAIGMCGDSGGARTYLEIGSGHSTRFARHAIERLGLGTRIVSIDTEPRAEVDALCDEVVRRPLEEAAPTVFEGLSPGDVVFFDGSHRCLPNSDVTVFFLEVLPALPAGVVVGVHDVFWPADYPPGFADRWYSEQYVLGAYLLGLGDRARIHAATITWSEADRARVLASVPDETRAAIPNPRGASLWFSRTE
ncbi:MAG: class I SAM-dependent methyltransferase [Phycisphaerales bacterium JB040]